MPPLAGPADPALATAYLQAFFDLEEWYSAGRPPGKLDLQTLPPEHRHLAGLDGPAFEYYRSSMLGLFEQAVLQRPAVAAIRSLLGRVAALDPTGYRTFIDRAWAANRRFGAQRNNAYRQLRALPEETDVPHRLRTYLKAWADYCEIDFVLWFLGVLGQGLTSGSLRPDAFGGPDTATPQGALAEQVGRVLAGTPLQALHADAYDPALRNVAGHNSYGVEGHSSTDAVIVDHRTDTRWTYAEVTDRLVAAQILAEAVMVGMMWAHDVQLADDPARLSQRGCVSVGYVQEDSPQALPVVLLTQLWCFRDLDPTGGWLEQVEMTVTEHPDGTEEVHLGEFHSSRGEPVMELIGPALLDHGWVRVLRLPVAPALGLGHPEHTLPDGTRYEVVGPWDEHRVPVHLPHQTPPPSHAT